jgi:hypothetical protein
MFPLLLNEEVVQVFKYWHDGIRDGMRYRNRIYGKVRCYPIEQNLKAYDFANAIAQADILCCITCGREHYTIWVCLTLISQIQHSPETLMQREYEVESSSA